MKFYLDSKVYKSPQRNVCKVVQLFCDSMKDGQLLTTRKLALAVNKAYMTVRHIKKSELKEYKFKLIDGSVLWGNPKTIREFKKYYEQEIAKKI